MMLLTLTIGRFSLTNDVVNTNHRVVFIDHRVYEHGGDVVGRAIF